MNSTKKTIFLKSDKIGEGELGSKLAQGFLNAISEQDELPHSIDSAVLLTTANDEDDITAIFKKLEQRGVSIYSCGTCLDYYDKKEALKVSVCGNAKDTAKMLLTNDIVSL
ncbi:hypothetical protein [Sulfurimonas sp.]|uniref:hypothetical protein n=1 Tax=Sulfurimonas sp. TaxID=2022749 RepID=UPI0025FE143F|nr:hypothetical protein [Sulfurimonas sp.]